MTETALRTFDLTKQYGSFLALDRVSLTVDTGDIYGLVGRNGAGKTTLFKCVMGLASPTSGTIEIAGSKNLKAQRSRMGFLIGASFFPYLSARENLEYLCRVKGVAPGREVTRLLDLVGLGGVKKPFKAFSLGMKQRLGIAGALLGSPDIIVLDEPINGLDPQGIVDMREVFLQVHEQTGATLIISSHILAELDLVATRFGFIEQGVLVSEVTHEQLHRDTAKSLVLEVNDPRRAEWVLQRLGVENAQTEGNRLILNSHLDRSHQVARELVNNNIELYDMHRKETTLEEYFVNLVKGGNNARSY